MGSLAERIHRCGDGQGCENGAEEGHQILFFLQMSSRTKENGWAVGDIQLIFSPPRPTNGYGPGEAAEAVCTAVPEASPG